MPMRYYAPFPGGGSDPARLRGPHGLRIGDAERDAAAADLGEHYAAGRLTLDELHQRLDAVFAAKTAGQLTRLMADLPGSGLPGPGLPVMRARGPVPPGCGLPVNGRPPWAGPGGPLAHPGAHPGPAPYSGWGPAGFRYDGPLRSSAAAWPGTGSPEESRSRELRDPPTPTDRAGRVAALSLLLLAMLIWLFTALLFARHGIYHPSAPVGPSGTFSQMYPGG